LAGGFGGICSRTLTAPLERVKLQAQVSGEQAFATSSFRRVVDQIMGIHAREGFYSGLMAGNLVNCTRVFPMAGLSCLFYSRFVKWLPSDDELDRMEFVYRFLAGAGAGACAACLTCPLDVVRARVTLAGASIDMRKEAFSIHCMYRGILPTLCAVMPFIGAQQASYDVLRMGMMESGVISAPSVTAFAMCGALAGVVAQTLVYPLDVMRRRIQVARSDEARSFSHVLRDIKREVHSSPTTPMRAWRQTLFAGIVPTYMKVVPAVATSVVCRDFVLGRFN